jgi:hypothetical protein
MISGRRETRRKLRKRRNQQPLEKQARRPLDSLGPKYSALETPSPMLEIRVTKQLQELWVLEPLNLTGTKAIWLTTNRAILLIDSEVLRAVEKSELRKCRDFWREPRK